MEFESLVEVNANKSVEKMFGDKDNKLKVITKMDLLDDGTEETKEKTQSVLQSIKKSNEVEAWYIKRQLFFN